MGDHHSDPLWCGVRLNITPVEEQRMNGRAKRLFYRFAVAIEAEVLDRLDDAWFEDSEVEDYKIQTEDGSLR